MAHESMALVSNALNKLEAGQLGVCRYVFMCDCVVLLLLNVMLVLLLGLVKV